MQIKNKPFNVPMLAAVALACAFQCAPTWAQSAGNHPQMSMTVAGEVEPRFNFSVTDAPAAQVFAMLGSGTPYNVIVPSGLEGKITITLKNATMAEALQAISDSHGYDYKIMGRRVTIASNAMLTKVFKLNYLTGNRTGSSQVHVQSGALSQNGAQTPGSTGSNSGMAGTSGGTGTVAANYGNSSNDSSRVTMTSDSDFWRDTKDAMKTLVSGDGRSVIMNASAGVLVVKAYPREIAVVDEYLKAVQLSVQRQVMIEAKIVEVSLSDGSQSGVNWSIFSNRGNGNLNIGVVAPGTTLGASGTQSTNNVDVGDAAAAIGWNMAAKALGTGFYGLAFQGANFSAVLNFLQTQGGVQVLSSPRIASLNNQKALLKVGKDEFYVTNVVSTPTTNSNGSSGTPTVTPTLMPFFSGISLDVTPQIDSDGVITMHVHPAITDVREKQIVINLGAAGTSSFPSASLATNETDSVVRIKSGQIAAIGGLMSQANSNSKSGLPGLSSAPVIGSIFGQKSTDSSKRELVILIKPTIVDENDSYDLEELRKSGVELLPQAAPRIDSPVSPAKTFAPKK
jgi:MSHA biogenesis protein MshL